MIVEEAAEILEAQLVAVIPPSVQHLIMIGDHKQLRPVVNFHRLKKHHNLDLSLFERLINCKLPYIQLGFQCRMRDEIVDLLRELKIYENLQTQDKVMIWFDHSWLRRFYGKIFYGIMYYCHQYFRLPPQRPHTIKAKTLLPSLILYPAIRWWEKTKLSQLCY